jgi:hypothetical protein
VERKIYEYYIGKLDGGKTSDVIVTSASFQLGHETLQK